jgi:DNA-binding NarL/FixJ family response regulator
MIMRCRPHTWRGTHGDGKVMIDVALIEDDRIFREGLAQLVDAEPGMRCRQRYGSVEQALAAPSAPAPDVILLDIHLPGMLGSVGVEALCARYPGAAILMLTIYDDEDKVFESICNGARGYVLKKTPAARLIEHIREAHDGGAPMSPEIARKVIGVFRQVKPPPRQPHALTPQEVRLLALLADGHSYQNAAGQLEISINTIRNYVRSVYDKLHVHSKSEAVAKALKSGILR